MGRAYRGVGGLAAMNVEMETRHQRGPWLNLANTLSRSFWTRIRPRLVALPSHSVSRLLSRAYHYNSSDFKVMYILKFGYK